MEPRRSSILGEYTARCKFCGWTKKFDEPMSCGLKVGDILYSNNDPIFNQCRACKRTQLEIISVPEQSPPPKPKGFWNVPKQ